MSPPCGPRASCHQERDGRDINDGSGDGLQRACSKGLDPHISADHPDSLGARISGYALECSVTTTASQDGGVGDKKSYDPRVRGAAPPKRRATTGDCRACPGAMRSLLRWLISR